MEGARQDKELTFGLLNRNYTNVFWLYNPKERIGGLPILVTFNGRIKGMVC